MKILAIMIAAACLSAQPAAGFESGFMGEEHFGNEPLAAGNFKQWPGVVPVVNDKTRVYHQWVNGSEHCCYRGNMAALNSALQNFAKIKAAKLEIVLRPGPGIADTFKKEKKVPYDWRLQLYGGIAGHMATLDQGANIWTPDPTLFIRVTDRVDLAQLQIPANVSVLQISDLKTRYTRCLASKDKTVRGWCLAHLADLNIYDGEIMNMVGAQLEDELDWVRLNALSTIGQFGLSAKQLEGKIKANLTSPDSQLREFAQRALDQIAAAKPNEKAEQQFNESLQQIKLYCSTR